VEAARNGGFGDSGKRRARTTEATTTTRRRPRLPRTAGGEQGNGSRGHGVGKGYRVDFEENRKLQQLLMHLYQKWNHTAYWSTVKKPRESESQPSGWTSATPSQPNSSDEPSATAESNNPISSEMILIWVWTERKNCRLHPPTLNTPVWLQRQRHC
jgi:hypothetical protein